MQAEEINVRETLLKYDDPVESAAGEEPLHTGKALAGRNVAKN